jgi:hypothetical protein
MTAARSIRRLRRFVPDQRRDVKTPSYAAATAVAIGTLAAIGLLNRHLAEKAERNNPPAGRFLEVEAFDFTTSNVARASRWFFCTATAA